MEEKKSKIKRGNQQNQKSNKKRQRRRNEKHKYGKNTDQGDVEHKSKGIHTSSQYNTLMLEQLYPGTIRSLETKLWAK